MMNAIILNENWAGALGVFSQVISTRKEKCKQYNALAAKDCENDTVSTCGNTQLMRECAQALRGRLQLIWGSIVEPWRTRGLGRAIREAREGERHFPEKTASACAQHRQRRENEELRAEPFSVTWGEHGVLLGNRQSPIRCSNEQRLVQQRAKVRVRHGPPDQ